MVKDIFMQLKHVETEGRVDHYLVFPISQSVGVKLREGKFEVKSLVGQAGACRIGHNLQAIGEVWEKCSIADKDDQLNSILLQSSNTISISKKRLKCTFSQINDNWMPTKALTSYNEGCQVEITDIKVNGENHWSFSLEAFGGYDRLPTVLSGMATEIRENWDLADLINDQKYHNVKAMSYPVFLNDFY